MEPKLDSQAVAKKIVELLEVVMTRTSVKSLDVVVGDYKISVQKSTKDPWLFRVELKPKMTFYSE